METWRRLLAVVALCSLSAVSADGTVKPRIMLNGAGVHGTNTSLICQVTGSAQPVRFQWFHNSKPIQGERNGTLILQNVSTAMRGLYSCSVVTKANITWNSSAYYLQVIVPPVLSIKQRTADSPYRAVENHNLTLTCQVRNDAYPAVQAADYRWSFQPLSSPAGGGEIEDISNGSSSSSSSSSKLFIPHLSRKHSGKYTCFLAMNIIRDSLLQPQNASIDVEVLAPYLADFITLLPMEGQVVYAGEKVTLTCQVDSLPTATLTWLHGNRILRTVESNMDVFSLTATGCEDSGAYQCRAHNEDLNKMVSKSTQVLVRCDNMARQGGERAGGGGPLPGLSMSPAVLGLTLVTVPVACFTCFCIVFLLYRGRGCLRKHIAQRQQQPPAPV